MCVLPLQFAPGESAQSLGLTGEEVYSITGLTANAQSGPLPREVTVRAQMGETAKEFAVTVRIGTAAEAAYYRHSGILQYVLRQLLAQTPDLRVSAVSHRSARWADRTP
jgi:aconitate hydratase